MPVKPAESFAGHHSIEVRGAGCSLSLSCACRLSAAAVAHRLCMVSGGGSQGYCNLSRLLSEEEKNPDLSP